MSPRRPPLLMTGAQNDEIEKLGLERSSIYRKCRLDEIALPLVAGNLKNVPMEEASVRDFSSRKLIYTGIVQNLRDEVAMDVDDDEEGTQRVKRVPDYGIEVDFEALGEVDPDVRPKLAPFSRSVTDGG